MRTISIFILCVLCLCFITFNRILDFCSSSAIIYISNTTTSKSSWTPNLNFTREGSTFFINLIHNRWPWLSPAQPNFSIAFYVFFVSTFYVIGGGYVGLGSVQPKFTSPDKLGWGGFLRSSISLFNYRGQQALDLWIISYLWNTPPLLLHIICSFLQPQHL